MDDDALEAMGIDEELLDLVISASVKWTTNAWDRRRADAARRRGVRRRVRTRRRRLLSHREVPLTERREVCSRGEKRVATRFDVLPLFVERWSPRSFLDTPPSSDQLQPCSKRPGSRRRRTTRSRRGSS